jgi:hypothetical protein
MTSATDLYEDLILAGTIRVIKNFMKKKNLSFLSTYSSVETRKNAEHFANFDGEVHSLIFRDGILSFTIAKNVIVYDTKVYLVFYGSLSQLIRSICSDENSKMITFQVSKKDFEEEYKTMKQTKLCS